MNEPRKSGWFKKHLKEEHHLKTSDDSASEGAPSVADDSDQTGASVELAQPFASVAIQEAVVENPTQPTFFPKEESSIVESGNISEQLNVNPTQSQLGSESPAEEKINELVKHKISYGPPENVDLRGWNILEGDIHPSSLPPRNGMPIRVSDSVNDSGVVVFWKKTRAFANPTKKWEITGKWCNFLTGVPISFEPRYWRERNV